MEYSQTHCHFCNSRLVTASFVSWLICPDEFCQKKYFYRRANAGTTIMFNINEFKFKIYNGKIEIEQPTLEIDYMLDFKPDNYLEQVERIKKLQTFS